MRKDAAETIIDHRDGALKPGEDGLGPQEDITLLYGHSMIAYRASVREVFDHLERLSCGLRVKTRPVFRLAVPRAAGVSIEGNIGRRVYSDDHNY
jgi:hypothetical protein